MKIQFQRAMSELDNIWKTRLNILLQKYNIDNNRMGYK